MALTKNKAVLEWIDHMAAMTQPDQIVWIDGSEAQLEELRAQACATGEMEKLNEEKLPGCYLHRTAENDVARVEDRTSVTAMNSTSSSSSRHPSSGCLFYCGRTSPSWTVWTRKPAFWGNTTLERLRN